MGEEKEKKYPSEEKGNGCPIQNIFFFNKKHPRDM